MNNQKEITEKKFNNPYVVKTISNSTKDVDESSRTVSGMFNSYFFIDSDRDMLLPGAATKSIKERGPGTNTGNGIKHLKDHVWGQNIAKINVLDERTVSINGKEITGIYHESYYSKATDGNDMLIKIQEGIYDDRSIGFQYMNLSLAEKNSSDDQDRATWEKFYPMALNPEKADETGHFWVVPEIKLFEGSDVAFGANELTPFLGMKNNSDSLSLINELYSKLDAMCSLFKSGNLTDEGFHQLEMESLQIKSYIASIINDEPLKKYTEKKISRNDPDTQHKNNDAKAFFTQLLKK